MRSFPIAALALSLAAAVAQAQAPRQGARPAPPDHWMTIDSLAEAVGLTEVQRPEFVKRYDALNGVMKKAADERRKLREESGGGMPSREAAQTLRSKLEFMQTDLDKHYHELRKLLSEDQHERFDALGKPRLMVLGGRRPGG
jgi:hypothetical protein